MGTLYLVPTPIGNLEDITLRALRVLGEVDLIAAEDTRTTGRLLAHHGIDGRLTSYHEHNKLAKLDTILAALEAGDVALVSDAGAPGLSDPGYELVKMAVDNGVQVVPLPGANAVIPALTASGFPTDAFTYLGFLPRKAGLRRSVLEAVRGTSHTLVFYEAPHRLLDTLSDMVDCFGGDRQIVIARELTKLHEEIWRGSLDEAAATFSEREPRGEITLVVSGASGQPEQWTEEDVREALAARLTQGESRSAAARAVAKQSGWPRREIYNLDVR
jgi:16S rRNA (cytidine1402-2'-O)-methyltransferase